MAKFFDMHSKKPKKNSLIIRFIAEDETKKLTEEEQLNENSSFVRANLSNRQAMELTLRKGKNKKKSVEPNLVHKFKLDIEKKPVFIFLPNEKEKYELLKFMTKLDQNKKSNE